MLPAEWLTLLFAAALLVVAAARFDYRCRSWRGAVAAGSLIGLVLLVAHFGSGVVRGWFGLAYLAGAYWAPALLVSDRFDRRFAKWLAHTDDVLRALAPPMPRWLIHGWDICYLLCYPLVPAAYAVLTVFGDELDQRRFWAASLAAGFLCYGTLPWLVSLPPRVVRRTVERRTVGALNVKVLERLSHGFNTFPSGHAAVAVAAAVSSWPTVPAAAAIWGAVASGICVGAVVGHHHYIVDVAVGAAIGLICALAAFSLIV
jgi:hypothetical protein